MVVPIAFNHEGKTVISCLVYNFQVITDVILIIPILLPVYEDFVLFFRKTDRSCGRKQHNFPSGSRVRSKASPAGLQAILNHSDFYSWETGMLCL